METSAKEGINTKELFINCATILYEENQNLLKNKNRENLEIINKDNRDSFYLDLEGIYEEIEPCDC